MQKQTKNLVRLLYPGSFMLEESVEEVKAGENVLQKAFADKRVIAFQTGIQTSVDSDGETLYGKAKFGARSSFGDVYSVDELKEQYPDSILVLNIEVNGYLFAVKTRCGNWLPVNKGDKVYSPADCSLVLEISAKGKPNRVSPQPRP